MDERLKTNRRLWDEWTRVHRDSPFYDVPAFLAGSDSLNALEVEEVGPVDGRRLLHLQCHFGLDTLGWARRGASVTGVDFSPDAISEARRLAVEAGIEAEFVLSDIYGLADEELGAYDLVFTSYGVLPWLPDLAEWGRVIAKHLRPGGVFYMVEFHPVAGMLNDDGERITWPYLAAGSPLELHERGSYADPHADVSQLSYQWPHGLGDVVSAIAAARLRVQYLREHTRCPVNVMPFLEPREDGGFGFRGGREDVPLLFSLRAVRE